MKLVPHITVENFLPHCKNIIYNFPKYVFGKILEKSIFQCSQKCLHYLGKMMNFKKNISIIYESFAKMLETFDDLFFSKYI